MSKKNASDHLSQVPLFTACSKKELGMIAKATTELSFPDGTELMKQDQSAREAFVLTEGTVVVKRNGRKVAELGPGAFLGELGLLDKGPRTATVIAQGPVEALVLGPGEFAGLLDEVPSISHKLLKALAARIRELDAKAYG
ncbi:cyclic nucleotide-binding domain-containing protein [Acidimicrobiia bacterium EGI L10123]|uniref:Crp/Fnr family transcriptional regulator n=1 Tax=Salinilacustrithrix flava TaxID=2957203 RepID=UPI003D7C152D|nr:cyclic nucleotide-binding domain-containing protein [Acidimicrobiia bacterium EGI L10123]